MKYPRAAFLCLVASLFSAATAVAQDVYPSKLVRLVVPFAVGGSTDSVARTVAAKLQERWKQPVIVENWIGGNGVVGTERVAKV
jgi:tripartite-type tricarboxylate transporter receptor subunit TctC